MLLRGQELPKDVVVARKGEESSQKTSGQIDILELVVTMHCLIKQCVDVERGGTGRFLEHWLDCILRCWRIGRTTRSGVDFYSGCLIRS